MTAPSAAPATERPVTRGPGGRIVTNIGAWSPDSQWIAYDTRSDPAGEVFDGRQIEMVNVNTGEVRRLFGSTHGAHCGVVTFHPREWKVVFILGPENPTPDWAYNAWHRQGVIVDVNQPGIARHLEARDLTPPFTPGALRGGSHVHLWDATGDWVSFTYEDHVLASRGAGATPVPSREGDLNQRNIGVSIPGRPVRVKTDHPRNHDGEYFSVLVTRTAGAPKPGSDEISRASEEGWVGTNGYVRADQSRQRRALAFQGQVLTARGEVISEVFIADLPEDLTSPGSGPLEGTETRRPSPPSGVTQRRLTFTGDRKFPGIQGPRHWLRSSAAGDRIAFLARDDHGVVQLWSVSPQGGGARQVTNNSHDIASAFTWTPDGRHIAHTMDGSVCLTEMPAGATRRLTERLSDPAKLRPEACVVSPDGRHVAFIRRVAEEDGREFNQIWVAKVR